MIKTILFAATCLFSLSAAAQETLQTVTTTGRTTNQWLQITGSNGVLSTGAGLELYGNGTTGDGYIKGYNRATGAPANLRIQDTGGNTYMNENGGKVGIGTTTPGTQFNINQTSYPSYSANDKVLTISASTMPVLEFSRPAGSTIGTKIGSIYFTNSQNQSDAHRQLAGIWAENAGGTTYPTLMGGRLVFMTKAYAGGVQSKMIFDEKGNLGIGTDNTSTYKLAVEGTIGARRVKVTQAAWADFVFQPDYQLPSLQEVERFIKINKHLPDMPSEKEVVENGLDVGEMNKKLLQKVEEMMLYMIEQQKLNEQQSQRITQLEQIINPKNK